MIDLITLGRRCEYHAMMIACAANRKSWPFFYDTILLE